MKHSDIDRKLQPSTCWSAFLLSINIAMIAQIKYSGLFPEKHPSPIGTTLGLQVVAGNAAASA